MFVYCPNRTDHKVSLTPVVLLQRGKHSASRQLDRCWGFQLFYSRTFPRIGFVSARMMRTFISLNTLLFFRRTTKEDIRRWHIPNPTRFMSSIRG